MAKKRQAAPPQPLELEKTLLVDNQEYNVNAVHATQVDSNLIINQVDIEGTSTPTIFNGSTETEISIVPSSGGKFSGPICSESAINVRTGEKIKNEAVLNYGDFNEVILKSLINNSILYNWSSKTLTPALEESTAVRGISLVVGTEAELTSTAANDLGFAKLNAQTGNKWLPAYLYICTDTKNIYYGTSSSQTATQLAITAKNLKIPQKILVNLASTTEGTLDGSSTNTINPGITGTLAIANGGTGGTTKTAAAFNIFKDLRHTDENAVEDDTKIVFRVREPSTTSGMFYTKTAGKLLEYIAANHTHGPSSLTGTLPVTQGGTGATTKAGAITNIINGQTITPALVNNTLITIKPNQYNYHSNTENYGINMQNSDLVGVNGVYFLDAADSNGEGLNFKHTDSSTTWDRLYAYNGALYFKANTTNATGDTASAYELWHAGNLATMNSDRRRKITFSTTAPANTTGADGDIYIVY